MFYDKYVSLCAQKGVTPSAAAKEIGINKAAVSNWKHRRNGPSDITVQKIADYFGVTTDYLLGADGKRDSGEEMAGRYSPLRFWDKINENRSDFMHYFMQAWEYPVEDIANLWGVPVDNPEKATDEEFKGFLLSTVKAVRLNPEDGEWDVVIIPQTEKGPTPVSESGPSDPVTAQIMEIICQMSPEEKRLYLENLRTLRLLQAQGRKPDIQE